MKSALLVAALNILFTFYFAKKRWFLVSLVYIFATLVLLCLGLFASQQHFVVDGLVGLLGLDAYELSREFMLTMAEEALSPYIAIEMMLLISFVVLTAKTAERIIRFVFSKSSTDYDRSGRRKQLCLRLPRRISFEKKYLSYCEMLC